jgi:cell wall-associated NlpC family hydrolase
MLVTERLRSVAALACITALVSPLFPLVGSLPHLQPAYAMAVPESQTYLNATATPVQTFQNDADYSMPEVSLDSYSATSLATLKARAARKARAEAKAEAEHWEAKSRKAIIADGMKYTGKVPYVFGGETTAGWDCSGYTMYVYNEVMGFRMQHSVLAQRAVGHVIKKADAQPGDLVVFNSDSEDGYHVGIYLGNDQMMAAPQPGDVTKVSTIYIQAGDKIQFVNVLGLAPSAPKGYKWPAAVE